MAKKENSFWVALIEHCQEDENLRVHLWNGYVGWKLPNQLRGKDPQAGWSWPQYVVDAPPGGWPELTETEKSLLDQLAADNGGHPSWSNQPCMNFAERTFDFEINFSDLTLVAVDFSETTFLNDVKFNRTRFFIQPQFLEVKFFGAVDFFDTFFEDDVRFDRTTFKDFVFFRNVQFNGGATFSKSRFEGPVQFNGSKFSEMFFSGGSIKNIQLAGFNEVEFQDRASFRNVIFGENPDQIDESDRLSKLADFSDARFDAPTDFRNAVFNGAPTFYNCDLHEDTDFSRVKWPDVIPTESHQIDDAIRAWERLELMMSKLEKPLDRHQFYRLKMQTRRQVDSKFLRMFNWLFDVTCDYGWSITSAAMWWISHWCIFAVVLFLNAGHAIVRDFALSLKLFVAALSTAFANAHAFLGLASEGGYLESCRLLIEQNDQFGLLVVVGAVQAVLGPVFLFLLLLTMRNRFRLA